MPARELITGVVLAGGRGSRMGGADKGLQLYRGRPLAQHALERLAPQVGRTLIVANRHADVYAAFGAPVCADAVQGQPGPLAGFVTGLAHATTPWIVLVPCDAPRFPLDLVARLAAAVGEQPLSIAVGARRHPVFCLLHASMRERLARDLAAGERRVERWVLAQGAVEVPFDDEAAFANLNTLDDLRDAA